MSRKKVNNKGCGFNTELNVKCPLGEFEFTIELADNSYDEKKDLIACRGCAKQDKYKNYKKVEVVGEAGVKYCIIYGIQEGNPQSKKWKDCDNCKKKLENLLNECENWEVKRKAKVQEYFEGEHTSGASGSRDCDNCPNPKACWVSGGTEKLCPKCKEAYMIGDNNDGDVEPNKHAETCSQKDKDKPNQNNSEEEGYKIQLGKIWVGCPSCKWKRQLTNEEKKAPTQNKVKKCGSCDSIRILFYENEPFKSSSDKDKAERERERERRFWLISDSTKSSPLPYRVIKW